MNFLETHIEMVFGYLNVGCFTETPPLIRWDLILADDYFFSYFFSLLIAFGIQTSEMGEPT